MRALEVGLSSPTKRAEEAEVLARVLRVDARGGQAEAAADDLGDLPERDALVGDAVQPRARRGRLKREPVQPRGVQGVHGGPAVGPVADVAGHALGAGGRDQDVGEAVVVE